MRADDGTHHLVFQGGTVALEHGELVVRRGGHGWLDTKRIPVGGAGARVSVQQGDRSGPALVISGCEAPVVLLGVELEAAQAFVREVER